MPRIPARSFAEVVNAYLASAKFASLAPASQKAFRIYILLASRADIMGALPVGEMRPSVVQQFLDGLSHKPGAQALARSALKAVEKWAIVRDLLPMPITLGTEIIGMEGGHKPWTLEQCLCVEEHAPSAIARIITLGRHTGQRVSDLIRIGRADVEIVDGRPGINVIQKKTGRRLWIPCTPALAAAIPSWPTPGPFLRKYNGRAFATPGQLSQAWNRERDRNPELKEKCKGLVLHGLRATRVVQLARDGATTPQIVDLVGMSGAMVERYRRFDDQRKSATAAVIHLYKAGTR